MTHLSTYFDLLFARLMWMYVLFKRGMFYHSPQIRNTSKHGCTNSWHLFVLSTKCCLVASNIFQHKYCSLLLTYKNAYNFECTQQKAPDNSEARRLHNFGSSVWNLLHVTRLAARIWKWLLIFLENLWTPCWGGFRIFIYIKFMELNLQVGQRWSRFTFNP